MNLKSKFLGIENTANYKFKKASCLNLLISVCKEHGILVAYFFVSLKLKRDKKQQKIPDKIFQKCSSFD